MSTVLIADDDADHRELLGLALRRAGHDVVVTVDAASALAALRGGGIDAALLDVRMPGESGIELCRRLRNEPATALLPVILISADVNDRRILDALDAGADDYLTKPFRRAELCARLEKQLLNRSAMAAPGVGATWTPTRSVRATVIRESETLSSNIA
ncbi:response regulator [Actinoplanes sp. NPDC026619]|uniref:response regulator transcription factor n=1 Tax=Actinoplanes sp. NPDC026619 TaxID=3155798 RepID=UPI0033C92063